MITMYYSGDFNLQICAIDETIASSELIYPSPEASVGVGAMNGMQLWITGTVSAAPTGTINVVLYGKTGNMPEYVNVTELPLVIVSVTGLEIIALAEISEFNFSTLKIYSIENLTNVSIGNLVFNVTGIDAAKNGTSGWSGYSGLNGGAAASGISGFSGQSGQSGWSGTEPFTRNAGTQTITLQNSGDRISLGSEVAHDKLYIYGIDDTVGNWNIQENGLTLDGVADGDKNLIWANNGSPKWLAQIYRDENGEFWYLANQEGKNNVLTTSAGGRVGINKLSNFMNYHASMIVGVGLDDIEIGGAYTKNYLAIYEVKILAGADVTPNTYEWRKSVDGGLSYGGWTEEDCTLTSAPTEIENGVTVGFDELTGHTDNDTWRFGAYPQLPLGTFTVSPTILDEVQTTLDWTAVTPTFVDRTADANTSTLTKPIRIFEPGTNNNALYVGSITKTNAINFNLNMVATGVTLVVEYYNATSHTWVPITIAMELVDGTNNLSKSGTISWDKHEMVGWGKYDIIHAVPEDSYTLNWIRFRHTGEVGNPPEASHIERNGSMRFGVYAGAGDYLTALAVDSDGRTTLGGGNSTGHNLLQLTGKSSVFSSNAGISESTTTSLLEIDAETGDPVDIAIRLSGGDETSMGAALMLKRSRGTLTTPTNVDDGDCTGHIVWNAFINGNWVDVSKIQTLYKGTGTTYLSDMIFKTSNNNLPNEKMRITSDGVIKIGSFYDLPAASGMSGYVMMNTGGGEEAIWSDVTSIQGTSGISGWSGAMGESGTSGWSGASGPSGAIGESGLSGWSGLQGETGVSGISGWSGLNGDYAVSGISGYSGWSGEVGISGPSGASGPSGMSGWSGLNGDYAVSGISGFSGESGQSGWSGEVGASGQSGWSGEVGVSGQSGWSGEVGATGVSGTSGLSGFSGESGISGAASTMADISYFRRTGTTRERWYSIPSNNLAMTVSTQLAANTMYAHPFIAPKNITIDNIAVNCTTSGSNGTIRIGIYEDSNGEPSTRLVDAGEVSTDTTGVKVIALTQSLVGGRMYWFTVISSRTTHAFRVPALGGMINVLGTSSGLGTAPYTHVTAAQAYGALPASFPTPTLQTTLVFPAVFVRASA